MRLKMVPPDGGDGGDGGGDAPEPNHGCPALGDEGLRRRDKVVTIVQDGGGDTKEPNNGRPALDDGGSSDKVAQIVREGGGNAMQRKNGQPALEDEGRRDKIASVGFTKLPQSTFTTTAAAVSTIGIQCFDVYLSTARKVHTDAATNLSSSKIVEEYFVPWGQEKRKKAKYTVEGYSMFGGLACHVVNAHANNKSWNGMISANMFFECQGQIHLYPWAVPKYPCTADTSLNDIHALCAMFLRESALRTQTAVVYPLHLETLCRNLKKLQRGETIGRKMGTYVRCNPAFLRHSQRSCILWHVRRYELSRNKIGQKAFRIAVDSVTSVKKDWSMDIKHHPLFASTFAKGAYGAGAYELYRFLRDWHTHCHQNITELLKNKYAFEVMEYVVEIHFDGYLSDILFKLLEDGADIDDWLSELHPNLPLQNYEGQNIDGHQGKPDANEQSNWKLGDNGKRSSYSWTGSTCLKFGSFEGPEKSGSVCLKFGSFEGPEKTASTRLKFGSFEGPEMNGTRLEPSEQQHDEKTGLLNWKFGGGGSSSSLG